MRTPALFLAALLAACSTTTTTGRMPEATQVSQLQPGVTTIADARTLLGKPLQDVRSSDGSSVLSYARTVVQQKSAFSASADVASQTLVLFFDPAGKLLRVSDGTTSSTVR